MVAKPKIVVLIQARMGSSRLPGKMLMDLCGRPVVCWVYERASKIEAVDHVAVATTISAADDEFATFLHKNHIPFCRGSEGNVLQRFVDAGKETGADIIVRVTGDCPLLDPHKSSEVVAEFLKIQGCDYACNIEPPFLPDGLDTEVVSLSSLEKINATELPASYREHVTLCFRRHPERFRIASLKGQNDYSHLRLTLDEYADHRVLSWICTELNKRNKFGYLADVLEILDRHPQILEINKDISRNEGLEKSLEKDGLLSHE